MALAPAMAQFCGFDVRLGLALAPCQAALSLRRFLLCRACVSRSLPRRAGVCGFHRHHGLPAFRSSWPDFRHKRAKLESRRPDQGPFPETAGAQMNWRPNPPLQRTRVARSARNRSPLNGKPLGDPSDFVAKTAFVVEAAGCGRAPLGAFRRRPNSPVSLGSAREGVS